MSEHIDSTNIMPSMHVCDYASDVADTLNLAIKAQDAPQNSGYILFSYDDKAREVRCFINGRIDYTSKTIVRAITEMEQGYQLFDEVLKGVERHLKAQQTENKNNK